MSALQTTNISNAYKCTISICGHDTEDDKPTVLSRKDKAVMKIFRHHARSMFLKHRTRYEKDPPKFVKDLISTLQNGLQNRNTIQNGVISTQIKLKSLENHDESSDSVPTENCAAPQTELSPESKYILRFLRDITVEQAIIKQNFLVKLKEHLAERDARKNQKCEHQKSVTDAPKIENGNNGNINTNANNLKKAQQIETSKADGCVLPRDKSEIPAEQAILIEKLMAELKERLAKIKVENISDTKHS